MTKPPGESANGLGKKRWLEPKDYLTISLSSLAFIVSSGSAYFNILRTAESVSIISDREPLAYLGEDEIIVFRPDEEGEVAFVNSGNRPAVISAIMVLYVQPTDATEPRCPGDVGVNILTDFESTVLNS